jgi:hypothetical protein
MNGQYLLDRSQAMAQRVESETKGGDLHSRIDQLFQRILQRSPTSDERRRAREFVATHRSWIEQVQQRGGLLFAEFPRLVTDTLGSEALSQLEPSLVVRFTDNEHSPQLFAPTKLRVGNDFRVEMTFVLAKLYADAKVRTLVSQWDNDHQHVGWSIGITSRKSAHEPRNFIVQLVGRDDQSKVKYEVIVSGLRPKLNAPYRGVVRIRERKDQPLIIEFTLQGTDGKVETSTVMAEQVQTIEAIGNVPIVVGARHERSDHRWAGLLARVEISTATGGEQTADRTWRAVADWSLTSASLGRREGRFPLEYKVSQPADAGRIAFVDLAHVLLNTTEFLYLD